MAKRETRIPSTNPEQAGIEAVREVFGPGAHTLAAITAAMYRPDTDIETVTAACSRGIAAIRESARLVTRGEAN